MRVTDAVERGAWLRDRMGPWATVAGVAGTGFARYARVLHPVRADRLDLTTTDQWGSHPVVEEATWPWSEIAARNGTVMHPLVQWRRITDGERALDFPDGWRAGQSREGWLDPVVMAALTAHLAVATTTPDDVVAGIWVGFGIPVTTFFMALDDGEPAAVDEDELARLRRESEERTIAAYAPEYLRARERGPQLELPGREYVLLETTLAELANPRWGFDAGIGWMEGLEHHPVPQLLWPEDRAWLVATEIDWDSTIVAGPSTLIDAVLADPAFEAFEVAADADLTWEGDAINR